MKILLVAPHPFYAERGTPIAVRLLCETLCASGHTVDLLTYHIGSNIEVPSLKIIRIPSIPLITDVPIGFTFRKLVCDLVLTVSLFRRALTSRYDVIHAVEEAIFPALIAARFRGSLTVYDMDSSLPDQLLEKRPALRPLARLLYGCERFAVRRSDRIVAVCDDLAERARACDADKVVTVLRDAPLPPEPGGEPADDLRTSLGIDGPFALYVGNLEHYQGIDLMLEGFAQADSDMSLVVIGGVQADVERYQTMADRLRVRAHFVGPRPVGQLVHYLEQASILCSPRLVGTNTPMKVFSYLSSGRPIIATNIASHTQVMDDSCAILVAPTPRDFARGLDRLVLDEELQAAIGSSARRLASTKYSLDEFKRTAVSLYAGLGAGASA